MFTEFYKEWGTHYISDAKFGAKLVVQRRYSKSKVSNEVTQQSEQFDKSYVLGVF